ncbi:type 1 glutamine amidotransferase domain-containing protein [Paraburkholderia terrae]|uniref:type 1 glutamine amidotransferase domain-containing protein n=1 Tax=Paraburkholderia terrae TaxID=311230 RepID=UPI002068D976|nr:thiazole biosynthesis protein ThiJ [Paraburkholderia terrae]
MATTVMKTSLKHIVGAAFAVAAISAHAGNVLIVLSDSGSLDLKDGKVFQTGFYLNELMVPVSALMEAGHKITFATPTGRVPSLDRTSVNPMYFGGDVDAMNSAKQRLDALKITSAEGSPVASLSEIEKTGFDHFDAVYVPGGHAPMQDMPTSPVLGRLFKYMHQAGKTTVLECHGPIALLSTLDDPAAFTRQLATGGVERRPNWTYADYRMTVISDREEEASKGILGGGAMKYWPEDALSAAGASFSSASALWAPYMVVDRELITGQNPASAGLVAAELVKRLK